MPLRSGTDLGPTSVSALLDRLRREIVSRSYLPA